MLSKEEIEIEKAKKRLSKKLEDEKVLGMLAHIDKTVDEVILDNIAIETLLQYIKQLERENRQLKVGLDSGLDKDKKTCFYEDGNTGKCLGQSNINDDEPCEYCKSCEVLSIKGDD